MSGTTDDEVVPLATLLDLATFPFPRLSIESCIQLYHKAAFRFMNTVQTIAIYRGDEHPDGSFVIYTRRKKYDVGGLPHANREAQAKAACVSVRFPARFVTDVGANVMQINQGVTLVRPVRSSYLGERSYHQDSTFYMDEHTALEVFSSLHARTLPSSQLCFLRSLMLDRRTFQHLLSDYFRFSRDRSPGAPFTDMPGLKRIVVGFVYQVQDVPLVEGMYDDVVKEVVVRKIEDSPGGERPDIVVPCVPRLYEPIGKPSILGAIIDVFCQTTQERADLAEAGVDVVWAVVSGDAELTQRPDIIDGFFASTFQSRSDSPVSG